MQEVYTCIHEYTRRLVKCCAHSIHLHQHRYIRGGTSRLGCSIRGASISCRLKTLQSFVLKFSSKSYNLFTSNKANMLKKQFEWKMLQTKPRKVCKRVRYANIHRSKFRCYDATYKLGPAPGCHHALVTMQMGVTCWWSQQEPRICNSHLSTPALILCKVFYLFKRLWDRPKRGPSSRSTGNLAHYSCQDLTNALLFFCGTDGYTIFSLACLSAGAIEWQFFFAILWRHATERLIPTVIRTSALMLTVIRTGLY